MNFARLPSMNSMRSEGSSCDLLAGEKPTSIVAPFEDISIFKDVPAADKVFWQFMIPKDYKKGKQLVVELPSKLRLRFYPPAGLCHAFSPVSCATSAKDNGSCVVVGRARETWH